MVQRILAGEIYTPETRLSKQVIHIDGGKVVGIDPIASITPDSETLDATDAIVIPGLVDLQVNGALGWSFQAAHRGYYDNILNFHLTNGTTTLLPTIITAEKSVLLESLRSLSEYMSSDTSVDLPGIHLEGPFLAPEKSGAHDQAALCHPELSFARELYEAAHDQLVMITLAPELPEAYDVISYFSEQDVIVSAGHSAATFDQMQKAIRAGLTFVTHAGNASDWPHRSMGTQGFMTSQPGVVGTLLAESALAGSIIVDGYHFHAALVLPLLRLKSAERLILVSDASTVAGCAPGEYDSGGLIVEVHPNGFATSGRGGGWLAGSIITLLNAIQVAVNQAHIDLGDAVKMATLSPAKILKIEDQKGQIRVGGDADLLILNQDLSLRYVIVGGKLI